MPQKLWPASHAGKPSLCISLELVPSTRFGGRPDYVNGSISDIQPVPVPEIPSTMTSRSSLAWLNFAPEETLVSHREARYIIEC